ncbi:pimeloyl-ACP methyl ester carboxylesterase [Flavobacterium sp. 9]|uniref:alpha/beta fold hydrolase n=1 Tax=Flavobacterium sp. 9 TaxID=2035198 RepID=UPI000C17E2D1|nr:alpha/beta hydrolase [Flavobacterium sp. 9]PIF32207.1 pimeloyl-ACP methyl ester carboxylesterase [Flavobacterium sp. 9]
MKKPIKALLLLLTSSIFGIANAQVQMNFKFDTPYGKNTAVGKFAEINGAKIYYEEYGKGEPLLLIHGNGGSIESMGNQIDYFKSKYRVIVADSRGQGKSELKTDSLTYVQITKDTEELVNRLKLDSISIIGWSDGGIVGLQMGISGKSKIKKIVAMGANLRPDSTAIYSWATKDVQNLKKMIVSKIKEKDTSENWNLMKQLAGLLIYQPTIAAKDLSKIKAKVLIIAGDRDVIRNEHSVEIFENIPKAQLCIMPGETHFAPASSPEVFNALANKFLSEPFKRPDSDWTKWGK